MTNRERAEVMAKQCGIHVVTKEEKLRDLELEKQGKIRIQRELTQEQIDEYKTTHNESDLNAYLSNYETRLTEVN